MSLTVQEIFDIRVPEIVSDPVEMEKLNKFVDYVNNLGLSNGYGAQMNLAVALYSLHLYYLDKAKNNKSGITAGMVKSEKSYR